MSVFDEYARNRSARALPAARREEPQEQLDADADDVDAMGDGSKRRRLRLRRQFRSQVEQREHREQVGGTDAVGVLTIVAHPPTPGDREAAREDEQEEEEEQHETMISLPLQYRPTPVDGEEDARDDDDNDAASIVSDTFG